MRSLYVRILVALLATILASLVAFLAVFRAMSRPNQERFIQRIQARQIEDAVAAYGRGGTPAVAAFLDRLNLDLGATHYLIDRNGRDVISGEDRSAYLNAPGAPSRGPREVNGRLALVEPPTDAPYHLLIFAPPPPPLNLSSFLPYYALIVAAVALLCWLLALTIVSPIRQLAAAVDRFGRGDLTTRVSAQRRDEIGNLGRAFNTMAERIGTLLTAERRLLQDISHELRSPLARLNIAIELVRVSPDRQVATERLQKEVDRLTTLVTTLLQMTRLEGDPSARRSERVLVDALIDDVAQTCTFEAEARHCRVVVSADTQQVIEGDPELLRRAVENVLRNAIRYAPQGSDIELHAVHHGTCTHISVRDSGVGVPEELLPRLAQPFFRVDDSREAATGGVGLGLAIAERALHLHQGTLVAENAHPGLRVTITLPTEAI